MTGRDVLKALADKDLDKEVFFTQIVERGDGWLDRIKHPVNSMTYCYDGPFENSNSFIGMTVLEGLK